MSTPIPTRFAVFAVLALSMAATRFSHAGSAWLPPDASWAVFFIGGFYLTRQWRWALAILLIEAVGVDCLAIRHYGISNYCVTLAYWFIVPAYSALWLGGAWLRRHYQQAAPDLARLCASLDRKSTRLNSSHLVISYAVFCLKKTKPPPCRSPRADRHRRVGPPPSSIPR